MADPQHPAAPVPAGPPGYVIRPPQPSAPAAGQAPPANGTPITTAPASTTTAKPADTAYTGNLTQDGAILGVAIMAGLAIVLFFLRGAVRSHLIANRSSLSRAGGAAWALFAFLFCVAFTIVFGLIGALWTVLAFIIPLAVLCLVTLILFILLYQSATRVSR